MATETHTKRDSTWTHAQNTLFTFHVMLTSSVRDSLRGSNGQRQQEWMITRHSGKVDQA